jgi:hypothetical protein
MNSSLSLNKNHNLIKFPACFGFYLNILEDLLTGKKPRLRKVHSAGGRNCGITYCFTLFVMWCCYYQLPVIIYAFRKQHNLLRNTSEQS